MEFPQAIRLTAALCLATLQQGCATSTSQSLERGPGGTIAYNVQIESTEPGARIEVNGDTVGNTPMVLKIFGDRDGTFHNFGREDYVIKAYPVRKGQSIQTKVFRTGGWWSPEDLVPKKLYFDLNERTEGFSIDLPSAKPSAQSDHP